MAIGPIIVRSARGRRARLDRILILSTWSLATLRKELQGMVNSYLLFFRCFSPRNGGFTRVLMFNVCADISMFTSYQARGSSVMMGNGLHATVRGIGTVDLKFTSGKIV